MSHVISAHVDRSVCMCIQRLLRILSEVGIIKLIIVILKLFLRRKSYHPRHSLCWWHQFWGFVWGWVILCGKGIFILYGEQQAHFLFICLVFVCRALPGMTSPPTTATWGTSWWGPGWWSWMGTRRSPARTCACSLIRLRLLEIVTNIDIYKIVEY